jgi:hypothetical protein
MGFLSQFVRPSGLSFNQIITNILIFVNSDFAQISNIFFIHIVSFTVAIILPIYIRRKYSKRAGKGSTIIRKKLATARFFSLQAKIA